MTAIPFPVSSSPGVKPQEGGGRLINCFAEKLEPTARFPVVWRRCAGLRQLLYITGHSHLRGAIFLDPTLIVVLDTRVYTITETAGVYTAVNQGALAGTGPVTVARNNAATPDVVCISAAGMFNLLTGSAPTNFADADLPQANSVSQLNGYFLFTIGDGRIFASGLNAVTISTSAYTTAQRRPGGLLRGVAFRGEFFAFGPSGCEVYRDVGASPFPLEFVTMIPRGIVGTHAVAGWEEGWANDLIWAADDFGVYRLVGYEPQQIANDDVSRAIAACVRAGDGSLLEASVYMQGKHAIWRLTYPGVWTWEYNKTTGNWHERQSDGRDDCRGSVTLRAFDRWISGDRTTGKLFEIVEDYYREGADPLRYIVRSGAGAAFPSRLSIARMDFDFTAAVGSADGEDPVQTNPSVLIRWSKDGGYSFGNPVTRKIGAQGAGNNRVTVLRGPLTGPKGIVVEVEVDDPVHAGFLGGQMAMQPVAE
jgi:hypothetical protein